MTRLLSAKIRNEGQDSYQEARTVLHRAFSDYVRRPDDYGDITFSFKDGEVFMSSLNLSDFYCSCSDYQRNNGCKHYICFEQFYEELSKNYIVKYHLDRAISYPFTWGRELLEKLPDSFDSFEDENQELEPVYSLSVYGRLDDNDLAWQLRIRHQETKRPYVIKNVPQFLSSVQNRSHYRISTKHPDEVLALEKFDSNSQALIEFMSKIFMGMLSLGGRELLYYKERFAIFPATFLEEAVKLMEKMEYFEFDYKGDKYDSFSLSQKNPIIEAPVFRILDTKSHYSLECLRDYGTLTQGDILVYGNQGFSIPTTYRSFFRDLNELSDFFEVGNYLNFAKGSKERVLDLCKTLSRFYGVDIPEQLKIHDFQAAFKMSLNHENIQMEMSWIFDDGMVESKSALRALPFSYNHKKANHIYKILSETGFRDDFLVISKQSNQDFFIKTLPRLRRLGQVSLSPELEAAYLEDPVIIDILDEDGYLSVNFDFSGVSEKEVNAALRALWNQELSYQTKSGQLLVFDDETKKVAQSLKDLRARISRDKIRMNRSSAYTVSEVFKDNDSVNFSKDFEKMARDLTHPKDFPLPRFEVKADLRSYQTDGVRWLSMLNHYGFGGILADDMGLGKTLQTISFLQSVMTADSRVLIIAPAGLLYNWKEEFKKFALDLTCQVVYGAKAERKTLIAEGCPILITSYASFRQDAKLYQNQSYDYLILDEAQMIKNSQTKTAQSLRDFDIKNCFALSGTPIENRLEEIWSIFQVVLPGLLPSKKEFTKLSPQMVARFIQPFILRRRKEEVLHDLPDLTENIYTNELSEQQKTIYLAQLRQMQDTVSNSSAEELRKRKIEILAGLTRLRQICSSPKLFLDDYHEESGKLESLFELMENLRENGRRPLIFSQFRGMLTYVKDGLKQQGLSSFVLTGDTPADLRQEMTNRFNAGEKDAFLISLKAGGTGLNLTGADTVILTDLWWNPAVEAQAIGRSHRIGQTKNVEVYRLITLGTIEEKILALQESKKQLVTTVLDGKETKESLSIDDIKEILGKSQ